MLIQLNPFSEANTQFKCIVHLVNKMGFEYLCKYGDEIHVTPAYIIYRDRLIDIGSVNQISVRGKKFLINSYKQNTILPTMCIHMESHTDAIRLYEQVIHEFYHSQAEEELMSTKSGGSFFDWYFGSK